MDWISLKTAIAEHTDLSRDALHLLAGCGAHLLLVLLFRSWIGALWPVGLIALAEIANEWVDLTTYDYWGDGRSQQIWESSKDVFSTLAIPVALVLLCRLAPARFRRPERPVPASE